MPEEDLETTELKENIDQRLEDHEHHAHGGHGKAASPTWLKYLSLSTAIIAVLAAIASLKSGENSNEAIFEKNEAILNQGKATDQWGYYQAKSLKESLADSEADIVKATLADGGERAADKPADGKPDGKPALVDKLKAKAERYRKEEEEIKATATELEDKVKDSNLSSQALMKRHHTFAFAVTLLQIAIALSAISALTRLKPLWFVSMAVSAAGIVMLARGFL